jgi:branched-subunit amino acid ABC-type transport system permease component
VTIDGRFFAVLVMTLASGAVFAIGAYAAVMQRLTEREALAGLVLLVVALVAALWLRQWNRQHGGRQP